MLSVTKNEELVEKFKYDAGNPKPIEHRKDRKITVTTYIGTPHSRVHTNTGREHVNERLLNKKNKQDIETELNKIEQEMLSGDCPVLKGGKTWNEVK